MSAKLGTSAPCAKTRAPSMKSPGLLVAVAVNAILRMVRQCASVVRITVAIRASFIALDTI